MWWASKTGGKAVSSSHPKEAQSLNKPQMSHREAYRELDLMEGLPLTEVKAQYRRLAKLWHPDKNNSAEATARMVRINLAYEVLDKFFTTPFSGYTSHSSDPQPDATPHDWWESDTWENPEPEARNARNAKRGRNVTRKVKITLFEAAFGCKKMVEGEVSDHCSSCGGSGSSGDYPTGCTACSGRGFTLRTGATFRNGYETTNCQACSGTGSIVRKCGTCGGAGQGATREWAYEVTIKPGAQTGDVFRFQGKGGRSTHSFLHGDLVVTVEVMAHPLFVQQEGELVVVVPVSFLTWMLGGELVVPLLDGSRLVRFAPGQTEIELYGQGMPYRGLQGERGSLVVELNPIVDPRMTPAQRIVLEHLAKEMSPAAVQGWDNAMREWTHGSTESRFGPDKPKRKPAAKKAASKAR